MENPWGYLPRRLQKIYCTGNGWAVSERFRFSARTRYRDTKEESTYLDHLIDAFVFFKVPLHTRSEKARLVNLAKMYTIDTGLLNAMRFRNASIFGPLHENIVFY